MKTIAPLLLEELRSHFRRVGVDFFLFLREAARTYSSSLCEVVHPLLANTAESRWLHFTTYVHGSLRPTVRRVELG